jgi:ATP-dependent Clp protease, protease subunit
MSSDGTWGPANLSDLLQAKLFERRHVAVTGVLDDHTAGEAATALMTLDAIGDGAVSLRLDCTATALGPAFVLIDTIDLLGVPVEAICTGRLEGPAVGVFAVAPHRVLTPHARIHLCEPSAAFTGHATDIERWAAHHEEQLARFVTRLAEATGRPAEHIEADLQRGRYLNADEALTYGLADEVRRPGHDARQPRAPFGFSPPPTP